MKHKDLYEAIIECYRGFYPKSEVVLNIVEKDGKLGISIQTKGRDIFYYVPNFPNCNTARCADRIDELTQ